MTELERDCLWTDDHPMTFMGVPIGRRCAVARSASGELVVFSPLKATPETIRTLRSLGRVAAFVVPSRFHDRFYDGYFAHFSEAVFLANAAVIEDHPAWPLHDLAGDTTLLSGIRILELGGMPRLQEHVFLHEASKTLIVADALFNVRPQRGCVRRVLMAAAGIGERPGLCRLFKAMIGDKRALAGSIRTLLSWDFDRIVPGHGDVIATRAKDVLRHAYRRYLV